MDNGPLVKEEIDAGAELACAFNRYKPLAVVFWLRTNGENQRYLYLASEQIDDTNFAQAYHEVARLANQMVNLELDPFRVKVISADNPLAKAALEINAHFPNRPSNRVGGGMFGDVYADDVYIYPSTMAMAVA